MKLSEVDKNFEVSSSIRKDGMVFLDADSRPFQIYGIYRENGKYRRLPEEIAKAVTPGFYQLHSNTAGGRVRFRTDSPQIAIIAKMEGLGIYPHCAFSGTCGFDLYADGSYGATFVPPVEMKDGYEACKELGEKKWREITINFPTYADVVQLQIGLCEDAQLDAPTPYKYEKPIVFYGSSITQGGCASRPGNCYTSIVARKLDSDHINLGFSGNCRAHAPVMDHIKGLDMSVFVYDYDHNSQTPEFLEGTHEKGFLIVREARPDLPIVLMTRPNARLTPDEVERLEIIRTTYNNALKRGDKNVYLIEGSELMAKAGVEGTVDGIHPNDWGFASMAEPVTELLRKILEK